MEDRTIDEEIGLIREEVEHANSALESRLSAEEESDYREMREGSLRDLIEALEHRGTDSDIDEAETIRLEHNI